MEQARQNIIQALDGAARPALLYSSGKESQLLLELALNVRPDITVLWLRHALTRKQKEFGESELLRRDVLAFSYDPRSVYYLPTSSGLKLVAEYDAGGSPLPQIRDVADGEACGLKVARGNPSPAPWPFDVVLAGTLDVDEHPVFGQGFFPADGTQIGTSRFYAPLRHMSESDVLAALESLGVPVDPARYGGEQARDPDTFAACTRCLTGKGNVFCPEAQGEIEVVGWDEAGALENFKVRFAA